jgi:hypothetical protein
MPLPESAARIGAMSTATIARVGWWLLGIGSAWLGLFFFLAVLMPDFGSGVFEFLPEIFGLVLYLGYCPCGPILIWAGLSLVLGCYFSGLRRFQFSLKTVMAGVTILCVILGIAMAILNAIIRGW